jgi:hypothetical protein
LRLLLSQRAALEAVAAQWRRLSCLPRFCLMRWWLESAVEDLRDFPVLPVLRAIMAVKAALLQFLLGEIWQFSVEVFRQRF